MKLVSAIHFSEFGGPQNQALRLTPPLTARGVETTVVIPPGVAAERLKQAGLDVRTPRLGRIRAVKDVKTQVVMTGKLPIDVVNLVRLFRETRPDVVQLNGSINPHAAFAAKLLGIPVVWQLLDTRPPLKVRKAMAPIINRFADVVMPIGQGVADAHPGVDFSPDRTVVFYPPVDREAFSPATRSTLRGELGIDDEAPIVGVVGNLNPQKGHEHFIAAAAKIRDRFPRARFVLVGNIYLDHPTHTDYYRRLIAQAEASGFVVGETMFFLGARSDIPNVLAAFDVFALASVPNSEGTPTVILEAMAAGLPVVATDVGSVREVVAEGETGFVTRSTDSDAMAERFAALLADRELRVRMGRAGRERVEREFNLERCVNDHLRAYEMAIARRRGTRGAS